MAAHLYHATVRWERDAEDEAFARGRYSRRHAWRFDSGTELAASSSPLVVPKPWSAEDAVDPEEAFIASVSSCHMLTFLDMARRAGFIVDHYEDTAEGEMEKNAEGRMWIARIRLRPAIGWRGKEPDPSELSGLHHAAHDLCFIANSIRTEVTVEGVN